MNEQDIGYKYSVEVLMNLNHDRYKTYFTQFMVLHLGIFTAMNVDKLISLLELFSTIGMTLSLIWLLVLVKISLDIAKLSDTVENYELSTKQKIKVHETTSSFVPASRLMLLVPMLFFIVHLKIYEL